MVRARVARAARSAATSGAGLDVAAQAGDDAGEDHDEAVGAGVDDAGLAQHLELLGRAVDRASSPREQRVLEHLGEQRVLLARRWRPASSRALAPCGRGARATACGHLPDHGQHRALRRLAHRGVGARRRRGRARPRPAPGRPARPGGVASSSAAPRTIWLQDHAGVAARAHQRRARDRVDDLVAADLVDHLPVEAVELVEHGAQRQRHVVARVAVGDREHVEVVDLLAPLLEMGAGATPTTRRKRSIEGVRPSARRTYRGRERSARRALVTLFGLQAAGADVDAAGRPPSSIRTFCRFGLKRRRVATIEWLREFPNAGLLPQL